MKFDLLTGGQEIKLAILQTFWLFSRYFVCLIHISLLLSLCQDNKVSLKQAPGHKTNIVSLERETSFP